MAREPPADEVHGVIDKRLQDIEAVLHSAGTAWQVHDEGRAPDSREPTAQSGMRGLSDTVGAYRLRGDPAMIA